MTRVLIADDHAFLRTGVQAVLLSAGYDVVAAVDSGTAALVALASHDPDVLILDVLMAKPDGVEVLELMRASRDGRPVILLTAQLDDARLLRALRADVNGIIFKDRAEETLITCLDAVLAGHTAIPSDLLERALQAANSSIVSPLGMLAPREADIVRLVGQGLRNREIAQRLSMSEGTVKVYLHEIYRKLDVSNRTELAILVHASR